VLENGVSFPILIANNFFMLLFFWLFTFAVNLCHRKFVTADVTAVFVKINMVFSDKDKIFFRKSLCLKAYTAKRFTDEFPEKRWTKRSVNKLLQTLRDTGIVYRRPEN